MLDIYYWARSNWRYAVVGTLPGFVIYVTAKLLNKKNKKLN
jgi:hypothetical protein